MSSSTPMPDVPSGRPPRLAYRPREAAAVLGVSHQLVYGLLSTGRLRSIVVGRARLIPAEALADLLRAKDEPDV